MARSRIPPHDGSLSVVPGFVDFHAQHNANLPWAHFPSRNDSENVESITFAQFSQATHRVAHIFRPCRVGADGEVVTLLIHCDTILYLAAMCGLIRANLVPLPVSPRNSPEAVANLMEKTNSRRLVVSPSLTSIGDTVDELLRAKDYSIHLESMVSLYDVYPHLISPVPATKSTFMPYPDYDRPHDPDTVVMILHSSGSTGLPKPIPKTHKIMLQWATCDTLRAGNEMGVQWAAMALPTFHTMGIFIQFHAPLMSGLPVVLYTPQEPLAPIVPSPDNILKAAQISGCNGMVIVPSIVEIWAQDMNILHYLSSLKLLLVGGGPLSTASGNKLVEKGVRLQSVYGLTECSAPIKIYLAKEPLPSDGSGWTKWDWEWMGISDTAQPRWVPQGDGTYELQFLACETHQPSTENLPDVKGFATSDLWLPHPTKDGLWKLVGRQDDVIVLSSGEKIVPLAQENHVVSSPFAVGAVMFGRGQPQPGILVEPSAAYACDISNEAEVIKYRDLIWPVIEEANYLGPAFARLFKETIVVVNSSKPLPRAGKGTVMRKQALSLYRDEISQLFLTLEESSSHPDILPPVSWDLEDVKTWLVEHAKSLNGGTVPSFSTDIFTAGFDSLSATILRNRILGALRSSQETRVQTAAKGISPNFIFQHPTIHQLAHAIVNLIDPGLCTVAQDDPTEIISNLIDKYTAGLSIRVSPTLSAPHDALTVLVTGSTGNLGSHIVATLLSDQRIVKLYTFDRAVPGLLSQERLQSAFEDRGLPPATLLDPRLVVLTGDLNAPLFGLDLDKYDELRNTLTHVVHNAWKVNFNHSLASFETQIAGTRKLIDFCLESQYPPRLLFTSSISVAQGSDPPYGPIPEAPLSDPRVATSSGYSSSKYVVEMLIDHATKFGLRGTSLRIGQICGSSTTGAWNITDWVPILVKSGITLGCLPDMQSSLDWAPIDAVAGAILDLMVLDEPVSSVVNIVHPYPVLWSTVFSEVKDVLGASTELVPYSSWLAKLEEANHNATPALVESVPALQLLQFFRSIATGGKGINIMFSTSELCRLSSTMRSLEPLGKSNVRLWIEYWRRKGFITCSS